MGNSVQQWVRPDLLAQPAYRVSAPSVDIKLNQNESPWDWPREMKMVYREKIAALAWNRYPQKTTESLRQRLSLSLDVLPEQIVLANGSNEILQALAILTLMPGDRLCTLDPSFAVYEMLAHWRGAVMDQSVLGENFQATIDDLAARSANARLTIICNPNSPTGTLISIDDLGQVAEPQKGIVVVDEAYQQYSGVTALSLLEKYPNLVVTRTFSKAFAMAGFRVGYAVMSPALAEQVSKALLPFNLDGPAAVAAEMALDYQVWVQERVAEIVAERDGLITRINTIGGATALQSEANYFLMRTRLGARGTFIALLDKSILVRDVSSYTGCEDYLRITVGTAEENRRLLATIEHIL